MMFKASLRDGVRRGDITTTIRIWKTPRVKPDHRYKMAPGAVVVESVQEIAISDITPAMARESGFEGVVDLLKTAKHGEGQRVFFIRFHYVED
ncbi:ASCH domain-containing protein [Henriciella litoralis]|uniref:ASCH domain-containing protein n=1 Tax=Henriciella litoralis TaxID=568102 RepID=UPI000A01036D|nr:ASCH domain-containing protein [Henriciella litoralis]